MRGQHYRARDKTVRKMGRDGLTEENLRSGETVRISRREVDDLALPGTADDSINFQERRSRRTKDRKAGGRQRGGYFSDFKRPDNEENGSIQAGLYQTDGERADSYSEDASPTESYRENVQGTEQDTEKMPETDSGIREVSSRQIPADHSYNPSGRRKKYIPEPLAVRYRRKGKNAVRGEDFYRETKLPDRIQENSSHMGTDVAADSTPASENADMGTESDQNVSRERKKKQVYAYVQREKEKKKAQEGRDNAAHREEARHTGNRSAAGEALPVPQKDVEKKSGCRRLYQEQREKASRLSFGEEGGMVRGAGMRLAGRAAWKAAGLVATALSDDGADRQQEDMEEEALHGANQTGERVLRLSVRSSSQIGRAHV